MFRKFHQTLQEWTQKEGLYPIIHQLSPDNWEDTKVPPGTVTLWQCYLREILPARFAKLFFSNSYTAGLFLNKLLAFSEYIMEQKIRQLIEKSWLNILSIPKQNNLTTKILVFQRQLGQWIDGYWHQQIRENKKEALDKLTNSLNFRDKWQTSRFLSQCGYFYPHSKVSYTAWVKWSGLQSDEDEYDTWLQLLTQLAPNDTALYQLDQFFHSLFSPETILSATPLCLKRFSCYPCPLKKDCQFFKTDSAENRKSDLENNIRTDNNDQIKTDDLLKYLSGGLWQNTSEQHHLIEKYPNLSHADLSELTAESDEEKLFFFLSGIQELNQRSQRATVNSSSPTFIESEDIYEFLRRHLDQDRQESFHTLILDNKHRKISLRLITKGTLNRSLVHPREVFAPAIQLRAAAIVLVHNHPSGDPSPSSRDVEVTKRLYNVGKIVGIKILDHIIMGDNTYYSFSDEEML